MQTTLSEYTQAFPTRRFFRRMGGIVDAHEWAPPLWLRVFRWLKKLALKCTKVIFLCAGIMCVPVFIVWQVYQNRAANENFMVLLDMPERNELYDKDGNFYRALPGPTTRKFVRYDDLPDHLVKALAAVEDTRFFSHAGINWQSVIGAIVHDIKKRKLERGASTITQQFIKMQRWGTPNDETWFQKIDRKIYEWALADKLERLWTKQQIVAAYLNRIDFGAGLHGIYAVCDGLFGKEPKALTPTESATVVAMIRSPDQYSPFHNAGRALLERREKVVLRRMVETGLVSATEADTMAKAPLNLKYSEWLQRQKNSYASAQAFDELRRLLPKDDIEHGGLKLALTLDSKWDARCTLELEMHLKVLERRHDWSHPIWMQGWTHDLPLLDQPYYPFIQGCVVAVDNQTGGILALAGGRNRRESELDRAMNAARPPGSTIKPFLYQIGYELGMSPDELVNNGPLRHGELGFGDPKYNPKNASDGNHGFMPMREGLIKSENLLTLRIGAKTGIERFIERLQKLGIASAANVPAVPSSFLGSFDVRPVNIVAAYTIFQNGGRRCSAPHIISAIFGQDSITALYTWTTANEPIVTCDPGSTRKTASDLRAVIERGTARSAKQLGLKTPAIGKTGTTDRSKDVWFIGSTDAVTCGCWIGFDKPQSIAHAHASVLALPCWVNVMNAYQSDSPHSPRHTESKRSVLPIRPSNPR